MASLLSVSNLIFAGLVLIEPVFFREVIDILIASSENNDSIFTQLMFTLSLWIGV